MTDKEKFEELGIIEGSYFEIKELRGVYELELKNKFVSEVRLGNGKPYAKFIVRGLYNSLLCGRCHKV